MSRPYITSGIQELETLFAAQRENPHLLKHLCKELKHRSTKRARSLLALVEQRLATFESHGERDLSAAPPEISPRGAQPPSPGNLFPGDEFFGSHPDDQQQPDRLVLMRPPGAAGLPDPWLPPIAHDISLPITEDADLPDRFTAALNALISEIKKTGSGQRRYELEKGVISDSPGGEYIYVFPFTDQAELFEDAQVELQLPGRRIEGSIVSISAGRLFVAVKEDLGPTIHQAALLIDATAFLEVLVERLEQVKKGEISLNRELADAVAGFKPEPRTSAPIALGITHRTRGELNRGQVQAYERALTDAVAWIWGPPGCGKTKTLGEIVRSAFENERRVLICSNTNKAVDQVIWEVCRALGTDHTAMEEGRVIRLGRIVDDKLRDTFADYVTVDGIVERRSKELVSRRRQLEDDIARIDARTVHARRILASFDAFDRAERLVADHQTSANNIAQDGRSAKTALSQLEAKLQKLETELQNRKGGLMRFFKRSEEAIQSDIRAIEVARTETETRIQALKSTYSNARAAFDNAVAERDRMKAELATKDRMQAEKQMKEGQEQRDSAVTDLREIEAKIAAIRDSVIREARVLGTTCTKAYLSAREIGQVEMAIIDEASMVMLPMAWFAAGLSRERVVVSGDYCQIPPIVQSQQKEILDVLARDAFTAARVKGDKARVVMLETQYRMDDAICSLVSKPMYEGRLKTAPDRKAVEGTVPDLFNRPLTIIDTSDLWPFESKNAFFSRFNLMHALLARNLAWHFRREGAIQEKTDLGICTPYTAQAKIIQKLLEGEDLDKLVYVGTVHRYQGDQRRIMLIEIPESHGGAWNVGQFVQSFPLDDVGARLINVAVTRAQQHLILMANLTYLDRKLPSGSLLRSILFQMQEQGRVIPGKDVLKLRPISHDLKGLVGQMPFEEITETLGIFDEGTFERAIEHDIRTAKESVVIFSGYVTPSRVSKLGDLFRSKIADGVRIRCVTRPPQYNGSIPRELGREALDMLEGIGVTVDCRASIHQKVCMIDNCIVWLGSLNALSHAGRSDETMTRAVNEGYAKVVASHLARRRISSNKAADGVTEAENPRCPNCSCRAVYHEGKKRKGGPYYKCESECGWKQNQKTLERMHRRMGEGSKDTTTIPDRGPACPNCGSETRLRTGKYGPFYSCVKYPTCEGTVGIVKSL